MCQTATLLCVGFLLLAGLLKCEPIMEQRQQADTAVNLDILSGEGQGSMNQNTVVTKAFDGNEGTELNECYSNEQDKPKEARFKINEAVVKMVHLLGRSDENWHWNVTDTVVYVCNGEKDCKTCGRFTETPAKGVYAELQCDEGVQGDTILVRSESPSVPWYLQICELKVYGNVTSVDLPESCKPCSEDQLNAVKGKVDALSTQVSELKIELADHAIQDQVKALSEQIAQLKTELVAVKSVGLDTVSIKNGKKTIRLVKLALAAGYTDNQAGMDKYVAACHAYGAYPIGCGTSQWNCPKSWNGCVAMPSSWGCSMMQKLNKHTGWDNVVTLAANPDKDNWYLKSYKGDQVDPKGSDQLHAVCAL